MTEASLPSPYKGLMPFEDSALDALLFFGRERERELITANLMASRLTVLYGASGVGKSSLLRAGVAHHLGQTERVAVAASWSDDPVAGLSAAVEAAGAEGEVFLILDQLEDVFLYHGGDGVLAEFARRLEELVAGTGTRVSVLLGIREESVAKLDAFKARLPNVLANYVRLEHLEREAARAAIVEPLRRYEELGGERWEIEPALVEAVLDEVSAGRIDGGAAPPGRIETPYLQLVMQRLWEVERAAGSNVLRLATLRELGGAERIVRDHLERALAALTPAQQDAAARMFDHLVTPSGAKVAHAVQDLVSYAGVEEDAAHGVIARLEGERILRPVEGAKVEIFHDVLAESVSAWRRGYEAGRELRRARKRLRRLAAVAVGALGALVVVSALAVYALGQRREAREQATLAQAQAAVAEEQRQIADDQRQEAERQAELAREGQIAAEAATQQARTFEARAAAEAQRARESQSEAARQAELAREEERRAIASGDEARRQAARARINELEAQQRAAEAQASRAAARRETLRAEARGLLTQATAALDTDSERSVRLALRASRLEASPRAEDVLRSALVALRLRAVLPGGGGALHAAAFSPDGSLVATAAAGGRARLFGVRTGRLLRTLPHGTPVTALAFSPDGRLLVTGARDGRARLWETATGARSRVLAHGAPITTVGFADGDTVVTAGEDGAVRTWERRTGAPLATIEHDRPVRSLSLQPAGRLLVTVTGDRLARVFNVATGASVAELEQPGGVTAAAFSPRGDWVVTGGARNAYVWEARGWERRHVLEGHTSRITAITFTPDNVGTLTTSADNTARLWRLGDGELLHVFTGSHRRGLEAAAVNVRGDSFATASADRTADLWLMPFPPKPVVLAGHRGAVTGVAFSPDGWSVLTASADGTARLWRARDPALGQLARRDERWAKASFAPDGTAALTATAEGTARLWNARGRLLATVRHGDAVTDVAFARGRVVIASADGRARILRADGTPLATLTHGAPVRSVALSPGGLLVAAGGDDGRLLVFGASGELVAELAAGSAVTSVVFVSTGTLASGGADGSVQVWDVRAGARLRSLGRHRGAVVSLATGPRGLLVSASADRTAHVYHLPSGRLRHALQGHGQALTSAVFSPGGRLVLTASADGDARTWSVRTGRLQRTFRGHVATVNEARFSPDGRWIVTAGPSAAGLWRTSTGELLFFLRGHTAAVRTAAFGADSRRVHTAGADGTLRAYRCDLCGRLPQLQSLARTRLAAIARGR